jgi:hypothetical protein
MHRDRFLRETNVIHLYKIRVSNDLNHVAHEAIRPWTRGPGWLDTSRATRPEGGVTGWFFD